MDLEELSKVYDDGDIRVIKADNSYFLESDRFKQFKTNEEVRKCTNELLSIINASLKFELKSTKPVEINSVIQITDEGRMKSYVSVAAFTVVRASVSATIHNPDGSVIHHHPAGKVKFLAELAEKDPKVKVMLEQIRHDSDTAAGLYNIWERMKPEIKNAPKRGWCSVDDANRFTQTLNSPAALGVHARHGYMKKDSPPPNPFTLKEAKSFVLGVVDHWFQYRYKILNETENTKEK